MRVLVPYLTPLMVALALLPLLVPRPAVGDNFQFWAAGHMVVTGQSPYERSSWAAVEAYGPEPAGVAANTQAAPRVPGRGVWLYPPQSAFLFAPFGALPFELGVPLLHLFILLTACAGIAVAARHGAGLRGLPMGVALSCVVLSQPFITSVRNGHPIGLLLLGATLTWIGLTRRLAWALAIGVILLSIKPHLFVVFGAALLLYSLARRDWRSLRIGALALALVTIPAGIAYPFPLGTVLTSTGERLTLDLSTLSALARDLGGGTQLSVALALVLVAVCMLAYAWAPRDSRPAVAFAVLLLLSAGLVPYLHDYDLLMCVPTAFAAFALASRPGAPLGLAAIAAAGLVLVPWLLFYWWPLAGEGGRVYQGGPLGAVPLAFGLLLAIAAFASRSPTTVLRDLAHSAPHEDERGVP